MRRASGRKRRPRLQSCVLCCALTATGLLALVHVAALRAMHEKPAVTAARDAAARTPKGERLDESYHIVFSSRRGVPWGAFNQRVAATATCLPWESEPQKHLRGAQMMKQVVFDNDIVSRTPVLAKTRSCSRCTTTASGHQSRC